MKFYLLLVAILAFSTTIDVSEAITCHLRASSDSGEGASNPECANKCYAYFDASGNNLGKCDTAGCDNPATKLWCKECIVNDCNIKSLISPKCYVRNADDTAPGTSTTCADMTPPATKCISYYNAAGNNLGACSATGCDATKSWCKECTTHDCNVVALSAPKCYGRAAGVSTNGTENSLCIGASPPAVKCVSYYNADGKNIGECKDGGCGSLANCQECTTLNCNVRSLVTTTPAPTAAPGAGATRASVGWQTGVIAASACVLVLMKPF